MNDLANAWLDELRSGKYEQGAMGLRTGDSYCCLGVACELYRQTYGKGRWKETDSGDFHFSIGRERAGGFLPVRVRDALGLDDIGGRFDDGSLAALNDGGATFAEIADIIESEPPGLFVEKEASHE